MKRNRLLALICAFALLLSIFPCGALAEDEGDWWTGDFWDVAHLVELGAQPPQYNAATQQYEISAPEQLLYLSGLWKPDDTNGDGAADAPCDGTYVLTNDLDMSALMASIGKTLTALNGKNTQGYIPPIACSADRLKEEGISCAFFGTFDGCGHSITNLRIERMSDKYAGLFGNVGHDRGEGYVRNLALIDMEIRCLASCGMIAGGLYGDIENCVAIGKIECVEKTAGGIAGKIKKNENGYLGMVKNCFVYADISVLGEGSENGAVGGITSAQSDGGRVYNCYVGGSINVVGRKASNVGGVSGNLKSGQALENTVMLLKSILVEDGTSVGLLCGDYSGETGSHLVNNYVWDGTHLTGLVTNDHPEGAAYVSADAETIQSKAFYTDTLGWDFDAVWAWVGEDESGYPMPKTFLEAGAALPDLTARIASDLTIDSVVLRPSEPMTNEGYADEAQNIACTLTLPNGKTANGVTLFYGADKDGTAFTSSVAMQDAGDGSYSVQFPETAEGVWYYYFAADADGQTVTFPNELSQCVRLELKSAAAKLTPKQVTVSPGETFDRIGLAWITDEGGLSAVLRYREAGASEWTEVAVTDIYDAEVAGGHGTFTAYSIDLANLNANAAYEYQVATSDGANEYATEIATFTTLPEQGSFSFIVISDLQATTEEGYLPFAYTMDGFVDETLGGVDFVVNLGDLTEDGSSIPQWKYMFNTLGGYFASHLNVFTAGNHESKGDLNYSIFKGVTNQPGSMDDERIGETTASFTVGNACFVVLNTEPYSGIDGADVAADRTAYYEAQKAWAKSVFEASSCEWRIVCAHAGLIQDDEVATAFLEQMCDELDVDLYFNGHIHNYYRATVRDEKAADVGAGTTFITTSPMGCKFDDFTTGVIDDLLQFQTGGSADERQYFTHVVIDQNGVTVTAYRLAEQGDVGKKSTFEAYDAIDSLTLTESLSRQHAPAAEPAPASDEPAQTEQAANNGTLYYILGGVAAAAVVILVIVALTKKKKNQKA